MSFGWPETTIARMPSLFRSWPGFPPTLASLIPPVSGLLQPTLSRPEVGAEVPERTPGASTSRFSAPSGSHFAFFRSRRRILADSPRPPRSSHSFGRFSVDTFRVAMFT